MRLHLCAALTLLAAGACLPARTTVTSAPTSTAAACGKDKAPIAYVIDGKSATCTAAMSLPSDRIASVEVLKGPAAVSAYGPSAAAGVVVIQTKRER
jgi:TonB-dependent SusC/RagA subfamily outer membrane receptor